MKKAAIVILNYNGFHFIKDFLPILIANTPDWAEIIIADNCSTDGSPFKIQSTFPQTRLILLSQNFGFAGGYNEALKSIEAEYYVLLNSDVEVTSRWLEPLIQFLDRNIDYAAVQPKIRSYHDRSKFEHAGACGGFVDIWGYPYCRGRIFDTTEVDAGQYDSLIDVDWCSGACLVIRSASFQSQGGFDPDFFAHMEEIDLCCRLSRTNQKLACLPESTVYHVGGGTLDQASEFKTLLNFRNNLYFLLKNECLLKLIWLFPTRFLLDLTAGFLLWKRYSFRHFLVIPKAYLQFIMNFYKIAQKRAKQLRWRRSTGIPLLLNYYILGHKTFQKINNTR